MHIGLLGFGVVGAGVYDWTRGRADLTVDRVLVRSSKPGIETISTHSIEDILNDPAIDTVVEVMGGLHPAYEYICAAIEAGKHVVTANKAVVAAYYPQLTALARQHGVALRCTAAVGGIMNGTSNFIMDAMHASPVSFPDILKKAQDLGYAEADPSADIDGDDIRRKLAISANVAFDALIDEEAIPTFGIRTVTDGDIAAFQRRGFVCKLLAAAQLSKEGICAWIEPTLVESHALEAAVPQNFNLITYYGESIGRQSFFGQGAGRYPTAYNVVQDCIDILCGQRSFYAADMAPAHLDLAGEAHPYYVRTEGHDDWLDSITVDRWEEGVITSAVSVGKMIAWAKHRLKADPTCFIAGIR